MARYYASEDYHAPSRHVLPSSKGDLYLPTSCGKYSYSSRYPLSASTRDGMRSPSLGSKYGQYTTSNSYGKSLSNITDKTSNLSLSSGMSRRPNMATQLLLEQNTSAVPHSSSRKARQNLDLDLSSSNSPRSTRHARSEKEATGKHNKITFDMCSVGPNADLPPKSPTSRRSRKYKRDGEKSGEPQRANRGLVVTQKDEKPVTDNGVDRDDWDEDGDEMKEGVSASETARWIGCGRITGPCILTADRGYLIWNRPKGKLEVTLRYGDTGGNFRCFMDPQFPGVRVLRDRNGEHEEIIDGVENPRASKNRHHVHSACRNMPENNFEFDSKNGEVRFILEALESGPKRKVPVFKINYTLIL